MPKELQAFPGQAHHGTHRGTQSIYVLVFEVVKQLHRPWEYCKRTSPNAYRIDRKREEVEAEKCGGHLQEQIAQQFGGQLPQLAATVSSSKMNVKLPTRITELTNMKWCAEEQNMMNTDKKDPLIDLKQQELLLRAQQLQQDREISGKKT